jgi:hypothetical protein
VRQKSFCPQFCPKSVTPNQGTIMASELDHLRHSPPDLACLDPLSAEVRAWLDRAYDAVKKVDRAEGVILKLHEQLLLDPARKAVASAEIVATLSRTLVTSEILHRMGVLQRAAG